jgi:hypothetical protein
VGRGLWTVAIDGVVRLRVYVWRDVVIISWISWVCSAKNSQVIFVFVELQDVEVIASLRNGSAALRTLSGAPP